MDRRYEVVVVGGGPSGSAAAEACAQSGLKTLLLEEQAHIGTPVQCAGLLSCSAFLECKVTTRSVLNTVSGATVAGTAGSFSFDAGKTKAFVVDRSLLDQEMAFHAAQAGVDIQLKTRACGLNVQDHILTTSGIQGKEEVRYQILIAADGPRATVGRLAGLPRAPIYLSGLQSDIPLNIDQDKVMIYPNASSEFFGWVIPIGIGRARVGLCGITGVKEKFNQFLSSFGHQGIHFVSGTIPLGMLPSSTTDGIMAVGDAAALAKPTSGGGVYTGVRSARHAAAVAVKACEEDRYERNYLLSYENRWKKDFGRELRMGYEAFRMRQRISQSDMDVVIQKMSDPEIRDLIVRKGDMDRPGILIQNLMLHPRMYTVVGTLFGSIIRSCFIK